MSQSTQKKNREAISGQSGSNVTHPSKMPTIRDFLIAELCAAIKAGDLKRARQVFRQLQPRKRRKR